jgi:hypothetical protein
MRALVNTANQFYRHAESFHVQPNADAPILPNFDAARPIDKTRAPASKNLSDDNVREVEAVWLPP